MASKEEAQPAKVDKKAKKEDKKNKKDEKSSAPSIDLNTVNRIHTDANPMENLKAALAAAFLDIDILSTKENKGKVLCSPPKASLFYAFVS